MDGVARLEAGHALPAAGCDLRAQRARRQAVARERQLGQGQHAHGAAEERARPGQQIGDARVARVFRPVDRARLLQRIAGVDLLDADHAPDPAGSVAQGGFARRAHEIARPVIHGQGEGKRPDGAVGQAQVLEHGSVIGEPEEADEGAGRARRDQLQVRLLARVERDLGRLSARWRRFSISSAGTKRSTSVPPWGSTSLDMTEGSWPGDGKAQPDEDDGENGPQGPLPESHARPARREGRRARTRRARSRRGGRRPAPPAGGRGWRRRTG